MDTINERFVRLRKACKKTQTEFGQVLGVTRSGVASIEAGQRNVTEKHLVMLSNWAEFNVNIDWLRTGRGEMFLSCWSDTLEAIRTEYGLTDLQLRFVGNFLRLPEQEKDTIFNFLQSVFDQKQESLNISEKVESYRHELEYERSSGGELSALDTGSAKMA